MSGGSRIGRFFNRRQIGLGWSVLWRLFLLLLPLRVIGQLVAWGATAGGHEPASPAAAIFALPVGGNLYVFPLAVPVMLFGLDWIGKSVARRRLERPVAGFIGWSIYWRLALLQIAGVVAFGIVLAPLILIATAIGGGSRWAAVAVGVLALALVPVLIAWSLNAAGWSLLRAVERSKAAPPVVAAGAAGPVRDWTRLFDRGAGFPWEVAGAWALAMALTPWLAAAVRALPPGHPFNVPALDWYPLYVLIACAEGAAFAWLSQWLRNGWLLAPAMAGVSMLLTLVEAAVGGGGFEPWFLLSAAAHGLLIAGGLVAGVRLLGAGFGGFFAGLAAGLLVHGLLVYPVVFAIGLPEGAGPMPGAWWWEILLSQAIIRPLQAVLLAGLLLAGVRGHLRRRGLRLAGGAIAPLAEPGA